MTTLRLIQMSMRILIVEDDAEISDYLVRGLREEGYVVESSKDGEDGWYQLKSAIWDLVILDWWLPTTDGLTLLKRYRQMGQNTPVLFLTARDSVTDLVKGLDAGADDYLCKPFSFEELLARIRVATRRKQQESPTILSYQDVKLDLSTHRVERAGKKIDLTAREYSLLAFFLRHPNEILTRTRIYENVWDDRYDGISNTLEVHIGELRRKLQQQGSKLIHTLRNRGYLFGDNAEIGPESN